MHPDELLFPKLKKADDKMPKQHYVAEEKLDGESMIIWRDNAYGRRISDVTGHRENKWDDMPPWVKDVACVDAIHGELHVENGTSSDVKSALVNGRETDWTGELCRRLRFTAYRMVGRELTVHGHRDELMHRNILVPRTLTRDLKLEEHVHGKSLPPDTTFAALLEAAKFARLEGFVLKELDTKELRWWKLKVSHTYDCIVMGTKDGTGMFYGDVGALRVGMIAPYQEDPSHHVVEVASVSGMTEVERKWMTEHRDELIGRVCEVEANGVCSKGRLHHPRFIRWREDKNPTECTVDQLESKR
jgi:hypothetical protein